MLRDNSGGGVSKAISCMCCGANSLTQRRANLGDFAVRESIEERQCQRPGSYVLRGNQSVPAIRIASIKPLQMHRRKTPPATDAPRSHVANDSIALRLREVRRQPHHENKLADTSIRDFENREGQSRDRLQMFAVTGRAILAPRQDTVEAGHL